MSVKHIKQYYEEVANQYIDMQKEIKEFEVEAQNGLIEPERLESIKASITPLMNNYERISYLMFLLNMPNKKSKKKSYEKRNEQFLKKIKFSNTAEATLVENKQVLDDLAIKIKY